jgi:hypothetical protein
MTTRLLAPHEHAPSVELLSAIFNLGIGLVDSLCDHDTNTGIALLELVRAHDLVAAAKEPRPRGWLRATLPPALAHDATATFTADIVEAFFATLHAVYPGSTWSRHRCGVGRQLEAALEAERRSVARPGDGAAVEELLECSRLTSVLPFEIVAALAGGDDTEAATLLGEAMWRIDDLVDLDDDARSGALNALLLSASSADAAAAEAAEKLEAGLRRASGDRPTVLDHQPSRAFLCFVQRYAGIVPSPASIASSNAASSTGRSPSGGT